MRFFTSLLLTFSGLLLSWSLYGQTFTNYTTLDGLASDNTNCVAVDVNDNLWIGTQSGVSYYDRLNWTTHDQASDSGLVDNNITAITATTTGNIWVGTSFGASVYDGSSWTGYTTVDGLGNNQVKYIAEAPNGNIWFGTIMGVSVFDGSNWTNYGTNDGIPFGGVDHIEVATNGNIWLSGSLGGAIEYDGNTFTVYTDTDGLFNNKVRAIEEDASGNKWIGTSDGITVYDANNQFSANHTRLFTLPAPDTLNPVEDVKVDSRGLVWAGIYVDYLVTEGGVSYWDGSVWHEFDVSDGLAGPVVRRIAIDSNDDVWVATSTGVSQISGIVVGNTPVHEQANFRLYPNPASKEIHIRLEERIPSELSNIALYDLKMEKVMEWRVSKGELDITLEIPSLPKGLYFLNLGNEYRKILIGQ